MTWRQVWQRVPVGGRRYVTDCGVALLVLAVLYTPLVIRRGGDHGPHPPAVWLALAGTAMPLVVRRRFPVICLLVIFLFLLWYNTFAAAVSEPISWGMLVAIYSIAWMGRQWQRLLITGLILAAAVFAVKSPTTATIGLLTSGGALVLGILGRQREDRMRDLAYRAGLEQQQRHIAAAEAVTVERARITRDMHDVLAHAVSLMVVQAEAGPVVVHSDPARAERAFDAIAAAGRDALVQLRRTLGILHAGSEAATRTPQPTIDALPGLLDGVRETGLDVSLSILGTPGKLTPDTEVAAYRIVQEALTNTVKHAAAGNASVVLDWTQRPGELVVAVRDDGAGLPPPVPGSGRGLVGIGERAAACGGSASYGPTGHGFAVTARLPAAPR